MINVSLSLLKHQLNDALTRNDREAALNIIRSIDMNNEEKLRLERDLDASEESFEVNKEVDEDENNETAPEVENHPEDDEIKDEDNDDDNNVDQEPICNQCGAVFKSKIALVFHFSPSNQTGTVLKLS